MRCVSFWFPAFRKVFLGAQCSQLLVSRPFRVLAEAASPIVQPGCPVSRSWLDGGQFSDVSGSLSQAVLVSRLASGVVGWPWQNPLVPIALSKRCSVLSRRREC